MKLTIYQKLLMFTLPVVCVSILGIGYYSYFVAREEIESEIRSNMLRQAVELAGELNRLCMQTSIDLVTLSELTSVADYYNNVDFGLYNEAEVSRKSMEIFMVNFSQRSKVYSGVGYINEMGMEIAKVIRSKVRSNRRNVKNRLFFKGARGLKSGEVHISPVQAGDDDQRLILQYATPVFNEIGEFKGVMTLTLDFEEIQRLVRNVRIGKTGYAYLIDEHGLLLAHPRSDRIFTPLGIPELKEIAERMTAGQEGLELYSTPDGDHLIGYAPIEAARWSVAVAAPLSDFMGKISRIKLNTTVTMLFIMVIASFGVLIIARNLSRPIKELVGHTRTVSDGNFDHQMNVSSMDEIGELTRSFNEMTKKLRLSQEEIGRWNRELEERVRITTAELTTERDKFEAVFEHMADGVIVLDEFSRVIDLNATAEAFVGMEKADLIGEQILLMPERNGASVIRNLRIICQPIFEEGYISCWKYFSCLRHDCPAYESEELRCWLIPQTRCHHSENIEGVPEVKITGCLSCALYMEIREKYRHGKQAGPTEVALDVPKRDIRIFKSPMFDNQNRFMGHVIVLQDITKDRELDKMKSEFISNVSHELRSPLTSIQSFSELILDDLDTLDNEIRKRFLGIIRDEAERLTRLISDILDLQKIQTDKMKWHMEALNLSQVIENTAVTFSGLAKTKRIHLSCECKKDLPLIYGDRDRLQQVMVNLISNAIKFSKENGQIRIEAAEAPDGVLISVSDKGIGIPMDKRERIFERFYQVDGSATKQRGGTGLGLAISKEIVEHHGGRIWVESKLEEGSKFSFVIPKGSVGKMAGPFN
jgi:signal transduction histidine kinase